MTPHDRHARRRFLLAVVAALALHAFLLPPVALLLPVERAPGPRESIRVSLFEGAARTSAMAYEPPEPVPEGQVVDAPEALEARPEADARARFLSEKAQTVDRETRATIRVVGPHRVASRVSAPGARTGSRLRPGVAGPRGRGVGDGRPAIEEGEFVIIVPDPILPGGINARSSDDEADPAGPTPGSRSPARAARPAGPEPRVRDGTSPLPPGDLLAPTVHVLAEAVEGTGMDLLEGIEEADATAVSTRPFAHAGFYRRVRDQVAQYWDPGGAFAIYDPRGRQYGYRDRETLVLVTLDCSGNLVDTSLLDDSGAAFLDEEAVSAIEQGAPFHNPPRDLCDARRNIIRFTFGFYVQTDTGPTLRVRLTR